MIKKSFTLIELLVVVAIIGILAAVGTPIFQGFIEESKLTVAKESCRTGGFRPVATIGTANDSVGTCRIGWENEPNVVSRRVIQCVTKIGEGATKSKPDVIIDSVEFWVE